MDTGAKRKVSLQTRRITVYFVCKSCGKTEQGASLSSSSASSMAALPLPKRTKLDVGFACRAATGVNARASTQWPTTSRPQPCSNTDDDDMDLGSPSATNPSPSNQRTSLSVSKRKAPDPNALDKLVDHIELANKAIAEKAEKKDAYSIEKVIDLLNTFDDLDPTQFNCALEHFHDEVNRHTFMYLSNERQKHYIQYIVRKNMR